MDRMDISIKRTYKDSVFRIIFSEKKELLELYNALSGKNYNNPDDLEINTLEDVIYLGMKNDISFVIDGRLNLFEHQSTFNPNMPLRGLFYISDLYKTMYFDEHRIYSKKLVMIPTPHYVVLYNGEEDVQDCMEMRLSDAYMQPTDSPDIEVVAHFININAGHNTDLIAKSSKLLQYTQFVQAVRDFTDGKSADKREAAIEEAIDYCIANHILEDLFRKERVKIMASILSEFNEEKYAEMLLKEGREEGRTEGKVQTLLDLVREGLLDISTAAKCAGMEEEQFKKQL